MVIDLPKELQKVAINELNEIPDRVEQDLMDFKEWLAKQPHINARNDDKWLLTVLRTCKWRVEMSKKKINSFYSIKSALPEVFKNRDPLSTHAQYILKQRIVTILAPQTPNSPVVFIAKCSRGDPEIIITDETITFATMVYDVVIREYSNFIVGQVLYYDMNGISFTYVKHLTPTFVKKMVMCLQQAYPTRLKAVYFVNVPNFLMYIGNILKPLLSTKIAQRIHLIPDGGKNECQTYIPASILPVDCGGEGPPMSSDHLRSLLESYRDWYKEDEQYGCDESKRLADSKLDVELFGVDGSFRKLDID